MISNSFLDENNLSTFSVTIGKSQGSRFFSNFLNILGVTQIATGVTYNAQLIPGQYVYYNFNMPTATGNYFISVVEEGNPTSSVKILTNCNKKFKEISTDLLFRW